MKNIGLDVKLLKIGLQYAQLRATGGNFLQLFSSQDNVKLEVDPSNYQNLTYLHAMVIEKSSTLISALSFYRSQNILGWSKFFVPDQKFIYISSSSNK